MANDELGDLSDMSGLGRSDAHTPRARPVSESAASRPSPPPPPPPPPETGHSSWSSPVRARTGHHEARQAPPGQPNRSGCAPIGVGFVVAMVILLALAGLVLGLVSGTSLSGEGPDSDAPVFETTVPADG